MCTYDLALFTSTLRSFFPPERFDPRPLPRQTMLRTRVATELLATGCLLSDRAHTFHTKQQTVRAVKLVCPLPCTLNSQQPVARTPVYQSRKLRCTKRATNSRCTFTTIFMFPRMNGEVYSYTCSANLTRPRFSQYMLRLRRVFPVTIDTLELYRSINLSPKLHGRQQSFRVPYLCCLPVIR